MFSWQSWQHEIQRFHPPFYPLSQYHLFCLGSLLIVIGGEKQAKRLEWQMEQRGLLGCNMATPEWLACPLL